MCNEINNSTKNMMKRFLFFLLALISLSCSEKLDETPYISVVEFRQRWDDYEATMVLKNNVKTEIDNVEFLITYLDMNGNVLDTKEVSSLINIKPEMRGELKIPAFRHNEHYQYHKNSDGIVGHPNFKITAKLQRYNIDDYEVEQFIKGNPEASRECSLNIPEAIMIIIVITIYIILPIALIIGLVKLVNKIKRKKKNKNN